MKIESLSAKAKSTAEQNSISGEWVFIKNKRICWETFEEGALLLDPNIREVKEINPSTYWIWNHIDGIRTVRHIADLYSRHFHVSTQAGLKLVRDDIECLWKKYFFVNPIQDDKGVVMDIKKYIQNPDVNLREEDEDGALLFNPDTDQVKLLSKTGHYIWKKCADGMTVKDIVTAFKDDFENVPVNQVKTDVEEFLNLMVESGFIGILDNPKE